MKTLTLLLATLAVSASAFASDGPGTRCLTEKGEVIRTHLETCPTNTKTL